MGDPRYAQKGAPLFCGGTYRLPLHVSFPSRTLSNVLPHRHTSDRILASSLVADVAQQYLHSRIASLFSTASRHSQIANDELTRW